MKILDVINRLLVDEDTQARWREEGQGLEGWRGLRSVLHGHLHPLIVFNPVALLAGFVFILQVFFPWWHATVDAGRATLDAFAFGLEHNVPPEGRRFVIETPTLASVFLLCCLFAYLIILLWGSTMSGRKGRAFVAISGFLMSFYTAGFYGAVFFACHRIGGAVSEDFVVYAPLPAKVHPYFLSPYYFAIGAGIICMLSSLLHGKLPVKIVGKK